MWTPWRRAASEETATREAHMADPGGFHSSPQSTTSSSKAPAGDSVYRAR